MKIEAFDIRFDTEDAVFSAGQNVTGTVILQLTKPTRILSESKTKSRMQKMINRRRKPETNKPDRNTVQGQWTVNL